jgi:hypothetical protein
MFVEKPGVGCRNPTLAVCMLGNQCINKPSSLVDFFANTLHASLFFPKRTTTHSDELILAPKFTEEQTMWALFLPPLYSAHSIRKSRATGSWSLGVFGKVPNCMIYEKRSREVPIPQVKTPTRDWHERCWPGLFYKMAPGYYMPVAFCI